MMFLFMLNKAELSHYQHDGTIKVWNSSKGCFADLWFGFSHFPWVKGNFSVLRFSLFLYNTTKPFM